MAATVLIREKNTAGETATDKTSGTVRFKNADDATVDLLNPLIVPTANTEYSFEKALRMHIGAVGPSSQITDLEFYMDGSNDYGTGRKLWGSAVVAFTEPAVPTETDDPPEIPVNGTPAAATNAFTWTSASPLSLGAGPYSATDADMGSYVYLVFEVEIGSDPGLLTAETATFEYDEI